MKDICQHTWKNILKDVCQHVQKDILKNIRRVV